MTTAALPSRFARALSGRGGELRAVLPTTLQVNVGKRCNQACHHCHVDASPTRTEVMPDDVVDACLDVLDLLMPARPRDAVCKRLFEKIRFSGNRRRRPGFDCHIESCEMGWRAHNRPGTSAAV